MPDLILFLLNLNFDLKKKAAHLEIYLLHKLESSIILGEVENVCGGNFSATIIPLISGPSLLHFTLNGNHIGDSPYEIVISPGEVRVV